MDSVTSSAGNEVDDVDSRLQHALDGARGPASLASAHQDAHEGSSEIDVAQRVT